MYVFAQQLLWPNRYFTATDRWPYEKPGSKRKHIGTRKNNIHTSVQGTTGSSLLNGKKIARIVCPMFGCRVLRGSVQVSCLHSAEKSFIPSTIFLNGLLLKTLIKISISSAGLLRKSISTSAFGVLCRAVQHEIERTIITIIPQSQFQHAVSINRLAERRNPI